MEVVCTAVVEYKLFEVAVSILTCLGNECSEYIVRWEHKLESLHTNLEKVCELKDKISKEVLDGELWQKTINPEAESWLEKVQELSKDEELKKIMYMNIATAKRVVKMMEKEVLKEQLGMGRRTQELVVKVMKKLKEEIEENGEGSYNQVAEVVVEWLKDDTPDDFKRLMTDDVIVGLITQKMLSQRELSHLGLSEQAMEEIVTKAKKNVIHLGLSEQAMEEIVTNTNKNVIQEVEGSNAHETAAGEWITSLKNLLNELGRLSDCARERTLPLQNLLKELGRLTGDADVDKEVPGAKLATVLLKIIDGIWIKSSGLNDEMGDNAEGRKTVCDRCSISRTAEKIAKKIKDDIISNCPKECLFERTTELEPITSGFLEGLQSRTELLDKILRELKNDQVRAVGIFGMIGVGKTTLAKEINIRAKSLFGLRVMVEVTNDSEITCLQTEIAESIRLPLDGINNADRRAKILQDTLNTYRRRGKKILIILDNVREKLDLVKIGIPMGACKFLFVSRDKDKCRIMDVNENNIHKVEFVTFNEARQLLKSQVENQVDEEEYIDVVKKLLNKCGGLPLSIIRRADELKGKDLNDWKKVADDYEQPISKQGRSKYGPTNSLLKPSYDSMEMNHKMFFLLTCLFRSSVSIERLVSYGIGLNLFKQRDSFHDALEVGSSWANILISSSMILEGDCKGEVKIHMIVRAFAICMDKEAIEGHSFLVDAIPKMMRDTDLNEFTAMSLTSMYSYRRLKGVKATHLQILTLKGDKSTKFDDAFFSEMENLVVLDLSYMNFQPGLPESMNKLGTLRTLCMENCLLGKITELFPKDLQVLSLRNSNVEELPNKIGELKELVLLDLCGCTSDTPDVQDKLCNLERVRDMFNINNNDEQNVDIRISNGEQTWATEGNRTSPLNPIRTNVSEIEEIEDAQINGTQVLETQASTEPSRKGKQVYESEIEEPSNSCTKALETDEIEELSTNGTQFSESIEGGLLAVHLVKYQWTESVACRS